MDELKLKWTPEPHDYPASDEEALILSQEHETNVEATVTVERVVIKEWWQQAPQTTPHTFELLMTLSGQDGKQATAEFIESVIDDIYRTKPLRSHFTVTQGMSSKGGLRVTCAARVVIYKRMTLEAY